MRRRLLKVAAVSATLCSLAVGAPGAVANAAASPGTITNFVVGTTFTMSNLDPTSNSYSGDVDQLSLETLLKFDAEGKLQPDLATSVSTPNPTTYVYQLRHGVTFWDGDPMTATDVAYSLNYDRRSGSNDDYLFAGVKNVEPTGPYTVTVATSDAPARFAIYSKPLRQLSVDVPYVPLYLEDENAALANNFTIPGFTQYSVDGPYVLRVRLR